MEKVKTGDYIIRLPQVKELLEKCLVNNMMLNEEINSVDKIIGVVYKLKRRNIGTLLKPVYEEVTVVKGIDIRCETESTVRLGTYNFEPGKGEEWIEKIIPRRIALLERIEKELKYMSKK